MVLKKLGQLKQLFEQVKRGLNYVEEHLDEIGEKAAAQNAKEMLKYIEKQNILKNSESILELINELGIKLHQLKARGTKKFSQNQLELDSIRKKIAQKKLINDVTILGTVSKTKRG